MGIVLQIITETFYLIKSAFFTILGIFFSPPDYPHGERRPVILIPGLMGSQFVWGKLRKQLIAEGYPVYVPNLGFQIGSFQKNGRKLEQFILEKKLKNVYVIGHSSGGMIVTQMGYKGRDKIRKFFAVSVPFHGTLLALFVFFIPAGRQLIPWSSFIRNNEVNFMTFSNLQCLYSKFDLTIIPGFQARLGRNDDIEYDGIGHLNIFMSQSGVDLLIDRLHAEDNKEAPKNQPSGQEKLKTPVKKATQKKPVRNKPKVKSSVKNQKKKI